MSLLNNIGMVGGAVSGGIASYFLGARVYSFKDLSGSFTHPDVKSIVWGGPSSYLGVGLKKITVTMKTERTEHLTGADGVVIPIYIAGNDGSVAIVCHQNSSTHETLLTWYNTVRMNIDNGDPSEFATAKMTLRSLSAKTGHIIRGISLPRLGEKVYASQGGDVTWILPAADIHSF